MKREKVTFLRKDIEETFDAPKSHKLSPYGSNFPGSNQSLETTSASLSISLLIPITLLKFDF